MILALALNLSGTVIGIAPSSDPAELAIVTMDNQFVNGAHDEGSYPLTLGDLSVSVQFYWDTSPHGADTMTITPPVGVVCIPADCRAEVPEGQSGSVTLIPYAGF